MNNSSVPATVGVVIDGHALTVPAGTTVLAAAVEIGVDIPTLCYHPNLTPNAVCRMCVVEPTRGRTLIPACVAPCVEGLEVQTDTPRVRSARKVILE
ncbi:MAG: 2Fe-2S iron-sulfur cluster-binding protein, partial [Anaerolineae bacterium]